MGVMTNIVPKATLRQKQLETLERASECLISAYGPFASTTAIRSGVDDTSNKKIIGAGSTIYTKDGHTILKKLMMSRPIEMTTLEDLIDITSETVKNVGDGTTTAVVLAYHIFLAMHNINIKYGISEAKLVSDLHAVAEKVIAAVDKHKHEATPMDIFEISMISTNGNVKFSDAIRQIYEKHGMGVHIDVGISNTENHEMKVFDGLTLESGFYNEHFINTDKSTSEIKNASIYVFEDALDTPEMMAIYDQILEDNIFGPGRELGELSAKHLTGAQISKLQSLGKFPLFKPTVIISTGYGNDMRNRSDQIIEQFGQYPPTQRPPVLNVTNVHDRTAIMDLCMLSGARSIKKYNSAIEMKNDQDKGMAPTAKTIHEFAGKAEFVAADNISTKIINPAKMYEYDEATSQIMHDENNNPIFSQIYKSLVESCETQLKSMQKTKVDITEIYLMKKRIASLKGNMVEYLVGGISMADRDSTKDLIEDAVLNCRSAAKDGVGYGANFEALRVLNEIVKEEQNEKFTEEELKQIVSGELDPGYSMADMLLKAYTKIAVILYKSAVGDDEQVAIQMVGLSLLKDCPCNLREVKLNKTGQGFDLSDAFDKRVLSSIKSDQVILNAISKIIGLTFASNQYLTASPSTNLYEQEAEAAKHIKAISETNSAVVS